MQIISPHSYRSLKSISRSGTADRYYPASVALERAFNHLCDNPAPPPKVTYRSVVVRAGGEGSANSVDVNVEALDRFVRALAQDDNVDEVKVGSTVVYTKPVCTGGVDEAALAKAVA